MRDAVDAVDVCRDLLCIIDDRPGDGGLTFKIINVLTLDAKAQYELIPYPQECMRGPPVPLPPGPLSPGPLSPTKKAKIVGESFKMKLPPTKPAVSVCESNLIDIERVEIAPFRPVSRSPLAVAVLPGGVLIAL